MSAATLLGSRVLSSWSWAGVSIRSTGARNDLSAGTTVAMGGAASEVTVGRKIHRAATVLKLRCTSRIDPDAWLRPEDMRCDRGRRRLSEVHERGNSGRKGAACECRARCPDICTTHTRVGFYATVACYPCLRQQEVAGLAAQLLAPHLPA